jgi:hypothetical protein
MDDGEKNKGRVKVKKYTVIFLFSEILLRKSLKAHKNSVNGATMKNEDDC